MSSSLVVVHDLDVPAASWRQSKQMAPLIIDANAMLPTPTAVQGLEPIARWNAQILKPFRYAKIALPGFAIIGFDLQRGLPARLAKR